MVGSKIQAYQLHCCLSLTQAHTYKKSFSLSLSLSLSPIPISLPLLSLCLSFSLPLLSFYPSLSSSSLSPTHVSLSIFVSPLSLLLPLCGSLSLALSLPLSRPLSRPLSLPPLSLFSIQILSSLVRDSSYHDMYYEGCGLLCAHKKSFNTAIPVRSLGPYMYVHYCTCIVHILVWTYLFLLTSFFDCLSFRGFF